MFRIHSKENMVQRSFFQLGLENFSISKFCLGEGNGCGSFYLVDPLQHKDLFSKDLLREFCQLQLLEGSSIDL